MGDYKKKHGQTRVGAFLEKLGKSEIVDRVKSAAGDFVTGDTLGAISTLIVGDKTLSQKDKETALELLKLDQKELEEVTKRWSIDMNSDSWLSKNIRPMTLASLLCAMFLFCGLDMFEALTVRDIWIKLFEQILLVVILAYFGSRGVEKFKKLSK